MLVKHAKFALSTSYLIFTNSCISSADHQFSTFHIDGSSFFHWLFAVDEALCHPYLGPLHDINEEPVCPRPFSFDFEQPSFTEENIKELIWRESVKFNPDPPIQWGNLIMWFTTLDVGLDSPVYFTKSIKNPQRKNKCNGDVVALLITGFSLRVLFSYPCISFSIQML